MITCSLPLSYIFLIKSSSSMIITEKTVINVGILNNSQQAVLYNNEK